ncbi:MAG: hypothetical protein V4450_07585 [Bacteroidota bacterium]
MKRFLWFSCLFVLASCSKKVHPVASKPPVRTETVAPPKTTTVVPPVIHEETPAAVNPAPAATAFASPMIVIDESGKIITSRDKLPEDIAGKVDYKKITRAFTPDQRQNLIYRFKMVPPRVLFVPEKLASKSAKGTYCVYKKKFWYWKKDDGLFYLDETYYQ